MIVVVCNDCGNTMSSSASRCRRCKKESLTYYRGLYDIHLSQLKERLLYKRSIASQPTSLLSAAVLTGIASLSLYALLNIQQLLKLAHVSM